MKEANNEIWYSQPIINIIYDKAMHEKWKSKVENERNANVLTKL